MNGLDSEVFMMRARTICVILLAMVGCDTGMNPPVHFVLPDAFSGAFIIIEDRNAPPVQKANGEIIVEVPESRIVRVRSFRFLQDWHQEVASYKSGQSVRMGSHAGPDVPASAIALRSVGFGSSDGRPDSDKYFVGTEREAYNYDFSQLEDLAYPNWKRIER